MNAETKVCPACAEPIRTAAKVCPHCRQIQRFWSIYNQNISMGLWSVLFFAGMAVLGIFLDHIFGPKHEFSPEQDKVMIVNSGFSFRGAETNLLVTVVGTITNAGGASWKEVGVEAQFFDANGKLIDVVSRTGDFAGVAILKHGEAGFKIEGRAAAARSDYVSHKVFVRWAKQADAWP